MFTFAKILFIGFKIFYLTGNNFPYQRQISNEEIQLLDLFSYSGRITVIDSKAKLNRFNKKIAKKEVIGFDTETRPSFTKGLQYDCSLVQMAFEDEVVLFRLNKIGFPRVLLDMLSQIDFKKIGIAIHDDIKQLKALNFFEAQNFIDLNTLSPKIGFESIGAKRLSALVLGKRISKRQQVSNWDAAELSPAQIAYAATDAWICREIYLQFLKDGLVSPEMI